MPKTARQMKKIMKGLGLENEGYKGFINYVSVDYESYSKEHFHKSVKKTLSIPRLLDKKAKNLGLNFSQILQEGLTRAIKKKGKREKNEESRIVKTSEEISEVLFISHKIL